MGFKPAIDLKPKPNTLRGNIMKLSIRIGSMTSRLLPFIAIAVLGFLSGLWYGQGRSVASEENTVDEMSEIDAMFRARKIKFADLGLDGGDSARQQSDLQYLLRWSKITTSRLLMRIDLEFERLERDASRGKDLSNSFGIIENYLDVLGAVTEANSVDEIKALSKNGNFVRKSVRGDGPKQSALD